MSTKKQTLRELYNLTSARIVSDAPEWTRFLQSACRNHNCRFDEQVLIYAQRPDAAAVLELAQWNTRFGRWVNRGSTGIAVFTDDGTKLKYYFDLSDTHEGKTAKPVPVWTVEPEYIELVIETLEASFGELDNSETLAMPSRIISQTISPI